MCVNELLTEIFLHLLYNFNAHAHILIIFTSTKKYEQNDDDR